MFSTNFYTLLYNIKRFYHICGLVKTKLKLAQIDKGDILEVLLSEGEPLDNVPRSAEEQGFKVLSIEHVEGTTHKVSCSVRATL